MFCNRIIPDHLFCLKDSPSLISTSGEFMIKLIMLMLNSSTSLTWAVFGGVAVEAHDPVRQSTVSFGVQGSPVFSCSGTVVSEDFVLLAGHCVRSVGSSALEIRFGLDATTPS